MIHDQIDWKLEIASSFIAKQEIQKFDKNHIYPCTIPKLATTLEDIRRTEAELGFEFDDDYAAFLLHGNGWDAFAVGDADLFGTHDYPNGERYLQAKEIAALIDGDGAFKMAGITMEEVFPFCNSSKNSDMYFIKKKNVVNVPRVYWFAGYLVDTFPSFIEFFRSMRAYDLINAERLKSG